MATKTEDTSQGPMTRWVNGAISNPEKVYRGLFYVALIFFGVTTLFPLYWLLVIALTPQNLIYQMPFWPRGFNPESFIQVFQQVPFHFYMFNSFVLATVTTIIVLLIASLAGYVFGRLTFPGRGPLMLIVLAISYFPPAAFFLPLYQLFAGQELLSVGGFAFEFPRLLNTPSALILPFSALFLPLAIFILTTFYAQIPDGLEDAARVEGTTRLGALFRVIVPLSAPGVATAAVLTFIGVYNEFFFSYLMVDGEYQSWAPMLWGLIKYQTQYRTLYNLMAAASIIGVLPVAILVIVAQEKIVSGLTAGALKE
ncbi:carbohydrate ABC transporter permease [Halegenticoccus tardaugens]|uniref:carbohydrate ABC transporter permease n=1 Tax=Halegenticoccus tardaugens TaxID=2071624 RepID=UPI00100A6976|nr:carbohydrate ABC transporter permease [Halegenticoccus tardaugens]